MRREIALGGLLRRISTSSSHLMDRNLRGTKDLLDFTRVRLESIDTKSPAWP